MGYVKVKKNMVHIAILATIMLLASQARHPSKWLIEGGLSTAFKTFRVVFRDSP